MILGVYVAIETRVSLHGPCVRDKRASTVHDVFGYVNTCADILCMFLVSYLNTRADISCMFLTNYENAYTIACLFDCVSARALILGV